MRCTRSTGLEVYHRSIEGGNGIRNTIVLCPDCYEPSQHPQEMPAFNDSTQLMALVRCGNQCQCEEADCAHD
jgi:hypothetical protein